MTDFLTSLTARTLAQPSLQPRVLSRFEPERRGEPLLPAEETELVRTAAPAPKPAPRTRTLTAEETESVHTAAPAPKPTPRTRSLTAAAPPAFRAEAAADEPAAPEMPRGEEEPSRTLPPPTRNASYEETPAPPPPRPAGVLAAAPSRGTAPGQPAGRRRDARESAAAAPAVREQIRVVDVPVVRHERETLVATHIETQTETREVRVPVDRPVVERRETRSRYEEAPPVIVETREEPRLPPLFDREERLTRSTASRRTRERRELRAAEPPAAPPQPEVHVSIGRVEVRATTAPAAGKARREPPRMMTIDDYVAHRARKERP
jgi:hypothetical protein